MPNRIIREGHLDSERVDELSEQAENFYSRLRLIVDDYGRYEYKPSALLSKTFPLRTARYTPEQIESWMRECTSGDEPLVIVYRVGRKAYLEVQNFGQRIRKDKQTGELAPSKYPAPSIGIKGSRESAAEIREEPRSAARATTTSPHTPSSTTSTTEELPTRAREGSNGHHAEAITLELVPSLEPVWLRWWQTWSSERGTNHKIQAAQAFLSVVTPTNFENCFACTESYKASVRGRGGGYNPENFLYEQARDGFQARWPPARASPGEERKNQDREKFRSRMAAKVVERRFG